MSGVGSVAARVGGRVRVNRYPAGMAPGSLKPKRSDALLLLIAWIDACAAERDHVYLDVVARLEARQLAKLSPVDRWLPDSTSVDIRRQLAERGVVAALLGGFDEVGDFRPGLAGLTEQEARATELQMEGFGLRQIAIFMDRKRAAMFPGSSLSVETVDRYLCGARRKLRALFTEEN